MAFTGIVLTSLVSAYLVAVVPWLGVRRYRRLQAVSADRTGLYVRSSLLKWAVAAGILVLFAAVPGLSTAYLFWGPGRRSLFDALLLVAAVGAGALYIVVRSRSEKGRAVLARAIGKWRSLLPATPRERAGFALVAVTAGVTEELAYRAYLSAWFAMVRPGTGWITLLVLTSAVFGLAHVYQGLKGVLLTGLVGAVLGLVYWTDGLLVAMLVHALIDLRLLLVPLDVVRPGEEVTRV